MLTRGLNNRHYSYIDFVLVAALLLISKSLYYDALGGKQLYIPFLVGILFYSISFKVRIHKTAFMYSLAFVMLVLLNTNANYGSVTLLILRLVMCAVICSLISFEKFSRAFSDIVVGLALVSLLTLPIIYFDIESPFSDFQHGGNSHRNFIVFGVLEQFILFKQYRINGLWWEPGAFQALVNIAFLFSLVNKNISRKKVLIFLALILLINSTTGLIVFMLLSIIYLRTQRPQLNRNGVTATFLLTPIIIYVFVEYYIPLVLLKFDPLSQSNGSYLARYYDMMISFELLKGSPLLGYGYGADWPLVSQMLNSSVVAGYMLQPGVTGSDGITLLVSQCGVFSLLLLVPLIWPIYLSSFSFLDRLIAAIVIIILFNTENFSFTFLFTILSLYGIYSIPSDDGNTATNEQI